MNGKFIYCTDEKIKDKLINKLELVLEKQINGKLTWIFENDNKLIFSNEDMSNITITNKFYI